METWLTSTKSLAETVSIKRSKLVVPTVTNTDLSSAILIFEVSVLKSSGCTHKPRFGGLSSRHEPRFDGWKLHFFRLFRPCRRKLPWKSKEKSHRQLVFTPAVTGMLPSLYLITVFGCHNVLRCLPMKLEKWFYKLKYVIV